MGKLVGFQSHHDAQRVVRAVKRMETVDISDTAGGRWDNHTNVIVAKLTGDDGGDPPVYSWEQQRATAGGGTESAGITGTLDTGYAIDLANGSHASGDIVTIARIPINNGDGTFDLVWSIVGGMPKGNRCGQVLAMVTDETAAFTLPFFTNPG